MTNVKKLKDLNKTLEMFYKEKISELCQHIDLSDGCLDMIKETLEALSGENADKEGIPPMMYPEWIKSTIAKIVKDELLKVNK